MSYDVLISRASERASGGIWPHSSANHYFIFCVGQSLVKVNAFMSWAVNHDVRVKPLYGKYRGQQERSFIANLDDLAIIRPWLVKEESILLVGQSDKHGHPKATLEYLATGVQEELGRLVQVPRDVAIAQDSWTFCPLMKVYYVCVVH